jgi:hypothetical protein
MDVNPLAVSSCTVWLKEAAFFGDFLCSSKESYPPVGEAATEKIGKTKEAAEQQQQAKKPTDYPGARSEGTLSRCAS